MAGEANIWNPRSVLQASADSLRVEESLIATEGQVLFILTTFTYELNSGALEVFKNGLFLTKGEAWIESSESSFYIMIPCTAGDKIDVVGFTAITAESPNTNGESYNISPAAFVNMYAAENATPEAAASPTPKVVKACFNALGQFSNATADLDTGLLTANKAGIYEVTFTFLAVGDDEYSFYLIKEGDLLSFGPAVQYDFTFFSGSALTFTLNGTVTLEEGESVQVMYLSAAGTAISISYASFSMHEIVPIGFDRQLSVSTMADLLAANLPNDLATITMLGFHTPGDGGGGKFYWDASSVATHNVGTVVKPTTTVGAGRWLRIFEPGTVNVKWFGAVCDGVTDDTTAVNAASAVVSTGGTVIFPYGEQEFTFTKPDYGVAWEFNGPEVTRAQLGGVSSAVRFVKPHLYYLDGPHATDQLQAEHLRVIAKGSNAIGAQYADYALGVTIEKENWSEEGGAPVAGEINTVTLFLRNGREDADPVKTGGAGILANIGQTAGSGLVQVLEAVNATFTKGTLATERETRLQILQIDEVEDLSYAFNAISVTGTQNGVLRVQGTTAAPWGNIIENLKDSIFSFRVNDDGCISWRNTDDIQAVLEIEETTGDMVFKNDSDDETFRIRQTGIEPRYTTGTSESITGADHERLVSFANNSPISCELANDAIAGTVVYVLQRDGGTVTFTPEAGATFRNYLASSGTTRQWSIVTLRVSINPTGTDAVWYLTGDTEQSAEPRYTTGTSETIDVDDNYRIVSFANAGAISCELSATAPAGTQVRALQRDAGQVTFTPGAGATLRNRQTHTKTAGQYALVTLEVSVNSGGSAAIWYLSGDTAA